MTVDRPVNSPPSILPASFKPRCLSIDLEVGVNTGVIQRFAGVRADTGEIIHHAGGPLVPALRKLDALAVSASFLLGHNILAFDLPQLEAALPDLALLQMPAVDTLRLNPLAFPRNPYHKLVKHYQDGQLLRDRLNDPELDARLTLQVLADQQQALTDWCAQNPDLVLAWHWLVTRTPKSEGFNSFFTRLRRRTQPGESEALAAVQRLLAERACPHQAASILSATPLPSWELAYALAWLEVAGGNSVVPPWVRHQFPGTAALIRQMRDTHCLQPGCPWCSQQHDACFALQRWFRFPAYRPEPVDQDTGLPLQQLIVQKAMNGESVLGILPTGTGKSVCYQVPALSRFEKTGALTVVISPLVALMADQVNGLRERFNIDACVAINGLLSMPERNDALERVRMGDVGILIIAPEQLRSKTVRRVLAQREIGGWVLDEAHCLSKWGQDFRPDYRYVGRFIREQAAGQAVPPVLCLTATAKPEVVDDIVQHFARHLGVTLAVLDGGSSRHNLDFHVIPTTPGERLGHVWQLLSSGLPADQSGGAIVYCSTRWKTEEVAEFLRSKQVPAAYFHAGMKPEEKKYTQEAFIRGDLQVIAATNAFGMGIDKPDVRLVIHADVPGSLENYLQEAGRAGRDQEAAACYLLYCAEDIELQFRMSARSRLTQQEIESVLRALRRLDRHKKGTGEIIATAGEILVEESSGVFERDSANDDTRVRTAIAWLEEASLLQRDENQVQVYPSSLRVSSMEEAERKLASLNNAQGRQPLLALVGAILSADSTRGISTDELMGIAGMKPGHLRRALHDLEALGIASNDTALTAYVNVGVERASLKKLDAMITTEKALLDLMREEAPDLACNEKTGLYLRKVSQRLQSEGHEAAIPGTVSLLLRAIGADGKTEDGGQGNFKLRNINPEVVEVTLQRDWVKIDGIVERRQKAAGLLLQHLITSLPAGSRGVDLLAQTTLGKLQNALQDDLILRSTSKDLGKLMDRALLWLHETGIIRLNKGLAIFRPAMTLRLSAERRSFTKADYAQLQLHYKEQVLQIHVMAAYVKHGLEKMVNALRLARDYFTFPQEEFLKCWLPVKRKELEIQTTPASWQRIVESLGNPVQQQIVTDEREQTSVLVLAGPGSGKTRVLVHRIAYLVRARRENPQGILALCYNRHAAIEIRRRLKALIGDDAQGVSVMTCHALAMRMAGISLAERRAADDEDFFAQALQKAVALLKGDGLLPDEADARRDDILRGFRWILVDEYQDINPAQYELIAALAGRTQDDRERRLSLFAVGDDDQNIYAFGGASVAFIRRFAADYSARLAYLTENYRSTAAIIQTANALIDGAQGRMKAGHPVSIDRNRKHQPPGGRWQALDPISQGRVQWLTGGRAPQQQAVVIIDEFRRMANLDPHWDWRRCAVIARDWNSLHPLRACCESLGIPVDMANEENDHPWRLRETQMLIDWLHGKESLLIQSGILRAWLATQSGPLFTRLKDATDEFLEQAGESTEIQINHYIEWLLEWGWESRRASRGLNLLTAHRAKGLEFSHVAIADGDWGRHGANEDGDAPRRLYYVAMTRAIDTLSLWQYTHRPHAFAATFAHTDSLLARRVEPGPLPDGIHQRYLSASMKDVDLGYAGRFEPGHPVHRRLAALEPGDAIRLEFHSERKRWQILNPAGQSVGRMAKTWQPPSGTRILHAQVRALIVRFKTDSAPVHQDKCKSDRWEVVLVDMMLEPLDSG